jgi:hypothetical protein
MRRTSCNARRCKGSNDEVGTSVVKPPQPPQVPQGPAPPPPALPRQPSARRLALSRPAASRSRRLVLQWLCSERPTSSPCLWAVCPSHWGTSSHGPTTTRAPWMVTTIFSSVPCAAQAGSTAPPRVQRKKKEIDKREESGHDVQNKLDVTASKKSRTRTTLPE